MQYTIRNIPKVLDQALRRRARQNNMTLNEVVIEAMASGLGVQQAPAKRRSVREIFAGHPKDADLEAALADQRRIDPELWR
jgi:hypothetical protein